MYADFLNSMGRHDEAWAVHREATAADPMNLIYSNNLGDGFYESHRFDEAIEQYKKTLAMDNNFDAAHYNLAFTYDRKRMHGEAIAEWQTVLVGYGDARRAALIGDAYARSGYEAALRAWIEDSEKSANREFVSPFAVASMFGMLGDKTSGMRWLEKAYDDRDVDLVTVKVEPVFDFLHSDPRFQDLLVRIGLEH
jgi:tetratricopeptide (TPR) repeat protein